MIVEIRFGYDLFILYMFIFLYIFILCEVHPVVITEELPALSCHFGVSSSDHSQAEIFFLCLSVSVHKGLGVDLMSNFPPARSTFPSAQFRQQTMASSRAADWIGPDDSASATGSAVSWSVVQEAGAQPARIQYPAPKPPPKGFEKKVIPESAPAGQEEVESEPDMPPHDGWDADLPKTAPPQAAPAVQAAKQLLGSAQKQAAKIASQNAKARKKGHRGIRWGQMPAANAQNFQLPPYVQQLGAKEHERSVLVIDSRDKRIQSPYQGWLLDEILLNAQSGINVLSDRQLVRSPNTGYHFNLFYVRTLDGFKFVLVGSMTSYGTVPCAKWDYPTGQVLSHPAFQPFRWPMMTDDGSTWVDVKVKVEGELLLHLELRGYRSDQDMTVQLNYINDSVIPRLDEMLFIPSVAVTVFQGWRVIATSFEVGGRLYACSDGGTVVALDFPLCHFEMRVTAISSSDSIGMDADRLEFRFRSSGDKVDVSCSQVVVPSTWLVVSRVSGPTLVKNAHWCRDHHARIEGPDQTMQLSQLAGIHAHWTASIEAGSVEETGPRVGAVAVESHASNLHFTCESPLFKAEKAIVPREALAIQAHNVELEQKTVVLPPVTGGPSVVPASSVSGSLRALAGPMAPSLTVAPNVPSEVALTAPGEAPTATNLQGGAVHVHRRPLEARQGEQMSAAAVTPQFFLDRVSQATSGYVAGSSTVQPGQPVSYGPPPVVEEVTDC